MATDWVRWHADYADPDSSLSRRLAVVQGYLRRALDEAPMDPDGGRRLVSMCAGDGRDVLPVLASHPRGGQVRAVLVELDPSLSARARSAAGPGVVGGRPGVEVRTADAGRAESYRGAGPARVLLACGVFGNISAGDVETTIGALPALLVPGGYVIWTRGRGRRGGSQSRGPGCVCPARVRGACLCRAGGRAVPGGDGSLGRVGEGGVVAAAALRFPLRVVDTGRRH